MINVAYIIVQSTMKRDGSIDKCVYGVYNDLDILATDMKSLVDACSNMPMVWYNYEIVSMNKIYVIK